MRGSPAQAPPQAGRRAVRLQSAAPRGSGIVLQCTSFCILIDWRALIAIHLAGHCMHAYFIGGQVVAQQVAALRL